MYQKFLANIPPPAFWLGNLLFWLLLNTVAADHTHRTRLQYGRDSDWGQTWIEYLPWWGNWALVAPLVIAAIRMISDDLHPRWRFVLNNILVMGATMLVYWGLTVIEVVAMRNDGSLSLAAIKEGFRELLMSPMHFDLLIYLAVACLGFTMSYYASAQQQALKNQKLSNQLLNVQLQSLKSQLSPHFLFNTLNTIAGLVRLEHKDQAVKALNQLSQMFRTVLENQKKQHTSLEEEMAFINHYLSIQTLRFENKLKVEIKMDPGCMHAEVPFMLLHSLVENAVQQGSQLETDQNLLKLEIQSKDDLLHIKLTTQVAEDQEPKSFATGLSRCHKRLRHLYQNGYRLEISKQLDGYYQTLLCIPMQG